MKSKIWNFKTNQLMQNQKEKKSWKTEGGRKKVEKGERGKGAESIDVEGDRRDGKEIQENSGFL